MRMILTIQERKKKDVWREITKKLNDAANEFTQLKVELKVENKWHSLVQSHKDIKDSKKKTGEKKNSPVSRKTRKHFFQKDMTFSPHSPVQVWMKMKRTQQVPAVKNKKEAAYLYLSAEKKKTSYKQ